LIAKAFSFNNFFLYLHWLWWQVTIKGYGLCKMKILATSSLSLFSIFLLINILLFYFKMKKALYIYFLLFYKFMLCCFFLVRWLKMNDSLWFLRDEGTSFFVVEIILVCILKVRGRTKKKFIDIITFCLIFLFYFYLIFAQVFSFTSPVFFYLYELSFLYVFFGFFIYLNA
jgi:hypothetical protein